MTDREPACAGLFYPARKRALQAAIAHYRHRSAPGAPRPVAVMAPHAGWAYCGAVMASAFAGVCAATTRRVIHLGPSHGTRAIGVIASGASAFVTPSRRSAVTEVEHAFVRVDPDVHRDEHSLEVQLPFIQACIPTFDYVPLLAGDTDPDRVAQVLESLTTDSPETLIVVSSDLSHYRSAADARDIDADTLQRIEARDASLEPWQACGAAALNGLTRFASRRGWHPVALERSDSSVNRGTSTDSVVGYGAVAWFAS